MSWATTEEDDASMEDFPDEGRQSWAIIKDVSDDDKDVAFLEEMSEQHQAYQAPWPPKTEAELTAANDSGTSTSVTTHFPLSAAFPHLLSHYPSSHYHCLQRVFYRVGIGDLRIDVPNVATTTPILLRDTLHTLSVASLAAATQYP
jgi:hypothetical protein